MTLVEVLARVRRRLKQAVNLYFSHYKMKEEGMSLMADATPVIKSDKQEGILFVNVFHTVDRADQERLVKSLVQVTEEVIRHQPGFISTHLHRSLDGQTVTNLARWNSVEDFKRALQTPGMLAHREVLGG